VEAANEAGGRDNITALFVAGSKFRGNGGATRPRFTGTTATARGRARPAFRRPPGVSVIRHAHRHAALGGAAEMTTPTRVGRYQIVRQIGRSMTDVYLAIDTVANRKTALKLVPRAAIPIRAW
jgi:hypothetical protein